MRRERTPPNDEFLILCPRLGHLICFSYCRGEDQGLPCLKVLACWYEHFLVEDYLRDELGPEDWDRLFRRNAKPKLHFLVELIEEARKRNRKST